MKNYFLWVPILGSVFMTSVKADVCCINGAGVACVGSCVFYNPFCVPDKSACQTGAVQHKVTKEQFNMLQNTLRKNQSKTLQELSR